MEALSHFEKAIESMKTSVVALYDFVDNLTSTVADLESKICQQSVEVKHVLKNIKSSISAITDEQSYHVTEDFLTTSLNSLKTSIASKLNHQDATTVSLSSACTDELVEKVASSVKFKRSCNRRRRRKINKNFTSACVDPVVEPPAKLPEYEKLEWRWLHVSNLAPTTTTAQLREFVLCNFPVSDVVCNSLVKKALKRKTRTMPSLSFKVGVLKDMYSTVLHFKDKWPDGVKVREFYIKTKIPP
jgi:hypothetical protein